MKTFQEFIQEETSTADIAVAPERIGNKTTIYKRANFKHLKECPCSLTMFMSLDNCTCENKPKD
jgi:hypothetical protein